MSITNTTEPIQTLKVDFRGDRCRLGRRSVCDRPNLFLLAVLFAKVFTPKIKVFSPDCPAEIGKLN
jgi:hypothetical protein